MPILPKRELPMLPASLSAAGIAFCSWVLMTGGEALCVTEGCSIFQDFRIAGHSLWDAGLAFFTLLLLLCMLRLAPLAKAAAALALAADCVLLGVMLFTAPCLNCLAVGLLAALCYLALRHACARGRAPGVSLLAALWTVLFLFNVSGILRGAAEPWSPAAQDGQPSVRVWFSPSCPACLRLVRQHGAMPGAAWYPVAENEDDLRVIKSMADFLAHGMPLPDAVGKARAEAKAQAVSPAPRRFDLLRPDMLLLQFRLWVNRAHVLSAGSGRLPFVEFLGTPSFLQEKPAPTGTHDDGRQLPGRGSAAADENDAPLSFPPGQEKHGQPPRDIPGIPELGVAGYCDGSDPAPCEDGDKQPSKPLIDTSGMM